MMKELTRYTGMVVVLAVSAGGYAEGGDAALYERRVAKTIEAATDWVIEDGISTYYQEGGEGVRRKLNDIRRKPDEQWNGVHLTGYNTPYVENHNYLAWFSLGNLSVFHDIINLHRKMLAGSIYEFWIVKIGKYRSSDPRRCRFYLTRADEVRGPRVILQRSDRFIARFEVAAGVSFDFPVDDLEVLSQMEAWHCPESYPDSDLKNLKVWRNWKTGRIMVERGDNEEWAYEENRGGELLMLAETTHVIKLAIRDGKTFSESEWEEIYEGLVRTLNQSRWPIKEKDWRRYYKRWFDRLERLDKTAAKSRFDAKERLNIEWEDKERR